MKYVLLTLSLLFCLSAHAQISGGINLEAVMKQMRFEYKQALKTNSAEKFEQYIINFKRELAQAKRFPFTDKRRAKAQEGLNKVSDVLQQLPQIENSADLARAKELLAALEQLQTQYHDKKPKTFWQKLFGD
ncbi:MAG: cytochrome b562 [Pseudomonadales bacterium]